VIFIGIDDTDNKESRGTGFLSRQLGKVIEEKSLGRVEGISRHQLFVHRDIPYTSQNSSACLCIKKARRDSLYRLCRDYLLENAADGSDVGLAMSSSEEIKDELVEYGFRAKKEILSQEEAKALAEKHRIQLEGLTGSRDGIIGALAAIGLRKSGNDGRFIWLRGKELREMAGILSVKDLLKQTGIDSILDLKGNRLGCNEMIHVGDWVRPVIQDNKVLLIADKTLNNNDYGWKLASKDFVKSISD